MDTYGCHGTLLAKRRARNPFLRFHPYYASVPALAPLFSWCPGTADGGMTALFPGPLPWTSEIDPKGKKGEVGRKGTGFGHE